MEQKADGIVVSKDVVSEVYATYSKSGSLLSTYGIFDGQFEQPARSHPYYYYNENGLSGVLKQVSYTFVSATTTYNSDGTNTVHRIYVGTYQGTVN